MNVFFEHSNISQSKVSEFIDTFAKIEYALKNTGFVSGGDRKVEANWDNYANSIHEEFVKDKDGKLLAATNFLLENPPRKQVLIDSNIKFVDVPIDTTQKTTQQLLLLVRRIRNNLLHGGKNQPSGELEEGRNSMLVSSSLTILNKVVLINEDVYTEFKK